MGQFMIHIVATGAHGCDRSYGDKSEIYGCRRMGCPDCQTREFIEQLKRSGVVLEQATFTHWPGTESEVKDNLITKIRTGSFDEAKKTDAYKQARGASPSASGVLPEDAIKR